MIKKAIFGTVVVCSAIAYSHTSKSDVNISKQIAEKQIECLAANVYHESRGESMAGQLAVALVTNNRKNDIRFPNTYCDVVYDFTDGATHYHADYVSPNWAKRYHRIVKIDQHIFYRTRR